VLSNVNYLRHGREGGGRGGALVFVGVSKALALKRVQLLFFGGFCCRVGSGSGCCILSICLMRSSSLDDVEEEIFSAIANVFCIFKSMYKYRSSWTGSLELNDS